MTNNENFNTKRPFIVAGPCSAESEYQVVRTCEELAATGRVDMIRAGVWKPRTSPGTFEGVGEKGLEWLHKAKERTGIPFGVETANKEHVRKALSYGADMIWLGARSSVNPFSVQEIADALAGSDVKVLIKNPVIPDANLWKGAVERLINAGVKRENIGLVHRGFPNALSNGYRNPPMWHLAIEMHRMFPDIMLLCDPSHICGNTAGLAETAQKAADLYFDGLMIESHFDPASALSDASQQLTPSELVPMLDRIIWRSPDSENPEFTHALAECRAEIDRIDMELFALLSRRMGIAEEIGRLKKENHVVILQRERWGEIIEKTVRQAEELNLDPDFVKDILEAVHTESINRQNKVMNED